MAKGEPDPPFQLTPVALVKFGLFSQTAPAWEGEPASTHWLPPRVKRRTAVAGSTTCSSSGPQQNAPPPGVHAGTFASTTLLAPCQPMGHSVLAPDCVNRSFCEPP